MDRQNCFLLSFLLFTVDLLYLGCKAQKLDLVEFDEKNNKFMFSFYKNLDEDSHREELFSSVSIYSCLLTLQPGASDEGRISLAKVLGLSIEEDTKEYMEHLVVSRNRILSDGSDVCRTVDRVWLDQKLNYQKEYYEVIRRSFGGMEAIGKAGFSLNPSHATDVINKWVGENTNQLIKELIPQGALDTNTQFVSTNAIYFKAKWKYPFHDRRTKDRRFTLINGTPMNVPTMIRRLFAPYFENAEYEAADLPYQGHFSMLIIVPKKKSIHAILKTMNAEALDELVGSMKKDQLDVFLPKFKSESSYVLPKTLKKMGAGDLFSKPSFSNVAEGDSPILLTEVIHKAVVSVTEEGTEAGAGTAAITGRSMSTQFRVNKPFAFFIRDTNTGTVLFFGKVNRPKF